MSISVRCKCGKTYVVADKYAGKKLKCKECDAVLAIQGPARHAKAKASETGEAPGFLEMDLDTEFTRMPAVQVQHTEQAEPQSQFADPFERRGLRAAGLDGSHNKEPQFYIPSMPRVENAINKLLPLLGVALGLGMIFATYLLSAHYGIFWPFLGASGIVLAIASLNWLTRSEE